jgi:hypothetical protein
MSSLLPQFARWFLKKVYVPPRMQTSSSSCFLESGEVRLCYLPELAGRITELSLGGQNVLSRASTNSLNFGSTYWTSPQADWGWPPVAAIDSAPFRAEVSLGVHRLVGPRAELAGGAVRLHKTYRPAPRAGSFDLGYLLENVGDRSLRVAGWEISRVVPGGLTFFPTGDAELSPIAPHAELQLERRAGFSCFDHAGFQPGLSQKVHADAKGGFLAHVVRSGAQPLLFLKTFADSLPEDQAPGEGEVEIFANQDGAYVELEVQGPYELLDPGQMKSLLVRWTLLPLEPWLVEPGAFIALSEHVRGLVEELGYPTLTGR